MHHTLLNNLEVKLSHFRRVGPSREPLGLWVLPLGRRDASIPSTTSDSVFISSSARLQSAAQENTESETVFRNQKPQQQHYSTTSGAPPHAPGSQWVRQQGPCRFPLLPFFPLDFSTSLTPSSHPLHTISNKRVWICSLCCKREDGNNRHGNAPLC